MTSSTGRLYALAIALVVFLITWSVISARPWLATKPDPRLAALAVREQRLRQDSVVVRRLVQHRWTVYRTRLRVRKAQIAAQRAQLAAAPAPSVQVVSLPPLTITRTS